MNGIGTQGEQSSSLEGHKFASDFEVKQSGGWLRLIQCNTIQYNTLN